MLDSGIFLQGKLSLYRLTRKRYASLSGVGASPAPERWNVAGEEAIYTCSEIAGTVLERLAHSPKNLIPSGMALMKIGISGRWNWHRISLG